MTIRELRTGEGQRAAKLAAACAGAAQWTDADYERLCTHGQQLCLVAERRDGVWAGLIAARYVAPEAEILNVAVLPQERRHGVATALYEETERRLASAGVNRIGLEVRVSNAAARAFYTKCGFQPSHTRRRYYEQPLEDALVLEKRL